MNDSFEEMKLRAAFMKLTAAVPVRRRNAGAGEKFGAVATPHIFIFDH